MPNREVRFASDYNRAIAAPVRWCHVGVAVLRSGTERGWRWSAAPGRITWLPYLVLGAVAVLLLLPYDAVITRLATSVRLGGDIRRELEAAQQYGQFFSSVLVATVIWLQDPSRRRRLADWAAAFVLTALAATALKMLVGRPRPLLEDPAVFLGPLRPYDLPEVGLRHAWEVWGDISSKLWSMPSSHTAQMAVMALFLATVYPRLRYLGFAVLAVVGVARVATGAHYLTDVIAGGAIGLAICHTVMSRRWGQRLLNLWPGGRSRAVTPEVAPGLSPASRAGRIPGPLEPPVLVGTAASEEGHAPRHNSAG
jgi:membrane-associated phospholipid phosphatase